MTFWIKFEAIGDFCGVLQWYNSKPETNDFFFVDHIMEMDRNAKWTEVAKGRMEEWTKR